MSLSLFSQTGHSDSHGLLRSSEVNDGPCECLLVKREMLHLDNLTHHDENNGWRCMLMSDEWSQRVCSLQNVPPGFVETLRSNDSGSSYLQISSAQILNGDRTTIMITEGARVSIDRVTKRHLQTSGRRRLGEFPWIPSGTHTFLIVRVTDQTGDATPKSAAQLSWDTFGPAERDAVNLVSDLRLIKCDI